MVDDLIMLQSARPRRLGSEPGSGLGPFLLGSGERPPVSIAGGWAQLRGESTDVQEAGP